MLIPKHLHDLDGFTVNRILPNHRKRMVGPFIFWDHMGPLTVKRGNELNVRPHPHIGLSTLTYLFEGKILHRDTLGFEQVIQPGEVNWMTAGHGIAHSERIEPLKLAPGQVIHGIQVWIALPKDKEEIPPQFVHIPELPKVQFQGLDFTLIAGSILGKSSAVPVHSKLFYLESLVRKGAKLSLPLEGQEGAIYVVSGKLNCADALEMFVSESDSLDFEALEDSHILLLGGETFPEKRHIWWNFVHSSAQRIEQAKEDWRTGKFGKVIHDEVEFIPLPGEE